MKSEYRRKQEAKERASKELQQAKKRLGIGPPEPLRGATPDPLVASTWERKPTPAPTSDRIPGSAPAGDFMHAHKWKRHARETEATVKEIRRKASKIAPAYNWGRCNTCQTRKTAKPFTFAALLPWGNEP